ncbi:MAG: hypothetical protein QOJ15_935 [Bradyrhizobium sp.]|nr:hypothetical protein [Bradyrhizobium sp.]
MKGDQWGFLPGPGAGIAGVTSVRATVFLIISAGGCAWRAALDIAATKFEAGCAEGGQGAKDTPRPAEGAERRACDEAGTVERQRGLAKNFLQENFLPPLMPGDRGH